jgi:hypothetical protein
MSKLSIYETGWINLVFENRNKEYGAYQLRQDCVKSSLKALFSGLLLVTVFGLLAKVNWNTNSNTIPETSISTIIDEALHVTQIDIPQGISTDLLQVQRDKTEVPIIKDNFIDPVIVSSSEIFPDIVKNTMMVNQTSEGSHSQGTTTVNTNSNLTNGNGYSDTTVDANAILKTSSLDKLPEFPGGIAKFYSYVGSNFENPEIEDHDSFRVIVNFIIEKDGTMTSILVKSDPGYGIGNEAIRVLKSLKTKWSPGMVNSIAVRTAYSLPIIISLE